MTQLFLSLISSLLDRHGKMFGRTASSPLKALFQSQNQRGNWLSLSIAWVVSMMSSLCVDTVGFGLEEPLESP
ncbi:hypothetical protein M426DRAFT_168717 [Hypoxylon sp. CI-4A]|nr:hypothetical protein M426DRAFT_168717 [Hypoxylon sp. CI-4A]